MITIKEDDKARLERYGHPVLTDSALLRCNKQFLLDYIRCLELSYAGALWMNDNQANLLYNVLTDRDVDKYAI